MSEERYVNLMPDYSKPEVWMPLVKAMMEGHQKQTAKTVRFLGKQNLTRDFFYKVATVAKDQQGFWKTVEEISQKELQVLAEMSGGTS